MKRRPKNNPVGSWWGAFEDGTVWPVHVISVTPFGTVIEAKHEAAPQGRMTLPNKYVYDSDFNNPSPVNAEVAR